MEFNEGRAAAEKNIEDPGALHEHRTADILARYLTGTETDAEASALLAASCNQPWALVGIGMSPRRGQADAQEIRRVINNAPIECAIAEIDDIAIVLVSYAEIRHLIEGALDKGKIGKLPICVFDVRGR